MSENSRSEKSISKIVEFALESLSEHERAVDELVNKLEGFKSDLLVNLEKSKSALDRIGSEIASLEDRIALAEKMVAKSGN